VRKYCRKSINCEEENTWYYCNKTSVPILPTFFYDLAVSIKENNYNELNNNNNEEIKNIYDEKLINIETENNVSNIYIKTDNIYLLLKKNI
jgi:hypothetical protein